MNAVQDLWHGKLPEFEAKASARDLIAIVEGLEDRGVGLRSVHENIHTTTASGRLFFHIMGTLAEFERNLVRERTRAGLLAAKRCGRLPGRKRRFTEAQKKAATTLLKGPC
jgi:DNA invertase Pin-like site-specific DNA recombinase